jgi:adenosylcobinamide-GDP ribazoletransferase
MDGFMDTCDAVFSRQDRKTRLKILSDTHVGAFAVMGCAAVLLLKAGIFSECFEAAARVNFPLFPVVLVPVCSRTALGVLFFLPFAREDGLARTLGSARVAGDRRLLIALYALLSLPFLPPFAGGRLFVIPLTGALFLFLWGRCCRGMFGGITGDLLGASVELSETLMFLALAASL